MAAHWKIDALWISPLQCSPDSINQTEFAIVIGDRCVPCILFVALVALGLSGPAQSAERLWLEDEAKTVLEEEYWQDTLSLDERSRLERHIEEFGSVGSHPPMMEDALGVRYGPVRGLPLDVFHEVIADSPEGVSQALLEAFNVQVVSPRHEISLPATAVLHSSLSLGGVVIHMETDMRLEGDSYYVAHPTSTMSKSLEALDEIRRESQARGRPTMALSHLSGFVFNEDTVVEMPPLGIAITFNIRYGGVRVDSGFQWAGRPASIPINAGEEFLR